MDNQFGAIASFFFDGGESSYQTRSTAVSFGSSNGCSMRSVFAAVRKSKPAMAPAVYAPKLRFSVSGCFRSSLKLRARTMFDGDHFAQIDVNRAPSLTGGIESGYQPGSLQLLASLNSGSTRSVPQSFLPARRGCF